MDPLHATIALTPMAVYLLLLGMLNLSARPVVTSGLRDAAALGLAISGFMVVGPMELFLPETLAVRLGWQVWPILILFYLLCLTLLVLLMRPRIIIYNISPEQLRSALGEVIGKLDPEARIAGESVCLPNLGVQLHLEPLPVFKNVQLKSSGPLQSYQGWRDLEHALNAALRHHAGVANPYGFSLMLVGGLMLGMVCWWMNSSGEQIMQAWSDMMRTPNE